MEPKLNQSKIDLSQNPKQEEFVFNTAPFSCYSGGYGSGKTYAGCIRGLVLSQYPGNVGLIGRMTYVELRDTTRKTFFDICPPEYYDSKQGGKWAPSENYLRLTNGSEILFRHLDTVSEKELLSLNLGWFYIDQAEEVSEAIFKVLVTRLRLNRVPNRYGFISCNPEYGNWIYNMFQKPMDEGKLHEDFHIINSRTIDNPYNPEDYMDKMRAMYDEEQLKQVAEGKWNVIENQIYKEFDYKTHVVKGFETPKSWEYVLSVDHGMVNPTAALLGALDHDGNIFIVDEYYAPGVVSEHARKIHEMTSNHEIAMWLIDPATQAKTREKEGMPWSIIEEYEDYNLFFQPANNEKRAGINRVKEFLRPLDSRRHPVNKTRPAPRLYIFQHCVNLIAEIQQYKWKKLRSTIQRNAPEQAVDYFDHAVDSLRYLIMSRFPPPLKRPLGNEMVLPEHRKNTNLITYSNVSGSKEEGSLGYMDESPLINNSFDDQYGE